MIRRGRCDWGGGGGGVGSIATIPRRKTLAFLEHQRTPAEVSKQQPNPPAT